MQLHESQKALTIVSILALIMAGALFSGCERRATNSTIPVSIATLTKDRMDYSDFADSISYIQLHGVAEPIGEVKTLKFIDSLMVIFDEKTDLVSVFDSNGKYLRQIGARGQGPGEYIYCRQIDVDRDKRNVLVYDVYTGEVRKYDLEGAYLGKDTVGRADDFAYVGDGKYLLANYQEDVAERAGIFLVSSSPFNKIRVRECRDDIPMNKPFEFFDCDGTISVMTREFEDLILKWNGDSLAESINFALEESPTKSQLDDFKHDYRKRYDYLNRIYFFDYPDFTMLFFTYKEERRYLFYDKKTHQTEVVPDIKNDIDSVYGYRMPISRGNTMVAVVEQDEELAPKIQIIHLK